MIDFYFQYDKERHKAKVVVEEGKRGTTVYYTDDLICDVSVHSVLQKESPQFVMRGKCRYLYYYGSTITLTNKK